MRFMKSGTLSEVDKKTFPHGILWFGVYLVTARGLSRV